MNAATHINSRHPTGRSAPDAGAGSIQRQAKVQP